MSVRGILKASIRPPPPTPNLQNKRQQNLSLQKQSSEWLGPATFSMDAAAPTLHELRRWRLAHSHVRLTTGAITVRREKELTVRLAVSPRGAPQAPLPRTRYQVLLVTTRVLPHPPPSCTPLLVPSYTAQAPSFTTLAPPSYPRVRQLSQQAMVLRGIPLRPWCPTTNRATAGVCPSPPTRRLPKPVKLLVTARANTTSGFAVRKNRGGRPNNKAMVLFPG